MSNRRLSWKVGLCISAAALCPAWLGSSLGASGSAGQVAAGKILTEAGVSGGLVVQVGCGDGALTAGLRASDKFVVHGLSTDAGQVEAARRHIRSLGCYGPVSVDRFDGLHLPYVDNLVSLVVSEGLGRVSMAEVMRVLSPGGVAQVKQGGAWTKHVKPWPADIDEWTHWLHGADGNPVANDTVVGPPRRAQWIAEPRWQRHHELSPSLDAMVSAGGRVFAIINEAPPGIDGLPDQWALVARDAFNGKCLWKRPIEKWGPAVWGDHSYGEGRFNLPTNIARRLVAHGDRVYVTLGFNAPLTALDAATGRTVKTYAQTRFADEILYHDGTLVLAVNDAAQSPGHISSNPPVGKSVMALNARSGAVIWKTGGLHGAVSKADAIERITHLMMALGGGEVFCVEEDAVEAFDLATGKRIWRRARGERPNRPVAYGKYYFTSLCGLVYHDGVVLLMEPDPKTKKQPWNAPAKATLFGISARTGEQLWAHPCGMWGHYNPGDIFVIGDLAWVHGGGAEVFSMMGLDPRSGQVKRTVDTREALDQGHHHRCYRDKATTRYFLTGRRGVEFTAVSGDRADVFRNHWVRGTCRYGIMPCNGLLYAPPHPCICYITAKLNGFWALAPAGAQVPPAPGAAVLERGPAFGSAGEGKSPAGGPGQWPTYRGDIARSGSAERGVSPSLGVLWRASIGGRPTSPVVAGGKMLVAARDAHTVMAFDAASGKALWSYTAGGRVDTPPTVHKGLAMFGSADGWVYCLGLDDGKLLWRLRAAPEDRRMMCREQLESPWPLHGSVLVQEGVAYFAAGRSSFLDGGIYIYAVEPATGKVLKRSCLDSIDPNTHDMVTAKAAYDMPPDALGALPDILVGDGSAVYMRHLKFNPTDLSAVSAAIPNAKKRRGAFPYVGSRLMSEAGLLDEAMFNQTFWTVDGKAQSSLLVFDDEAAYGFTPFAQKARHNRAVFRPGTSGYTLFAEKRPGHGALWSVKVPVRASAMLVAGPTLLVAGTRDVVEPDHPWAAIEGRAGGVLWAIATDTGRKMAEYSLDAPPVWDGLAAAAGRLYVATADGKVICFAPSATATPD